MAASVILRERMIEEIHHIPDEKLAELYDVIHLFRIGLESINRRPHEKGVQHLLDAINGIYGLWSDKEFDVDEYIRDLRKDRLHDLEFCVPAT